MRNFLLLLVFAGCALVSLAVSPFLSWAPKVMGCRTNSDFSSFLAYCNTDDFGDYEHGAFVWDLEPAAVRALKNARVIFLGNSRIQFAFSTAATRDYFEKQKTSYYLAGFTYFENMVFALALIDKYKLHPQAVVINSDNTFFRDEMLSTPRQMLRPKTDIMFWKTFYNYLLKGAFANIERPLCAIAPFLCAQTVRTIWRRRQTGEWLWHDTFADPNKFQPINPALRSPTPDEADMQTIEKAAEKFIGALGLPRQCIVITAIPNSVSTDEPVASRVATKLGVPLVIPHLEDLGTIDDSHLNRDSAERWSRAFLTDAGPILDRCVTH